MSKQFPSLVLVIFDAARAQNFGCYGYRLGTTPFLSSLAKKAAVYKNAVCSSYWTLPSLASLFTGTYVSRHGLIIDGHKIDPEMTTLAEYLSRHEYDTAGFCQNPYVSSFTGLNRGFHNFENHIPRRFSASVRIVKKMMNAVSSSRAKPKKPGGAEKTTVQARPPDSQSKRQWYSRLIIDKGAADMNRRAVAWLRNRPRPDRPFFLFLMYGETHAPYCPPLPYRTKFLRAHGPATRPLRKINQERSLFNTGQRAMSDKDIAGLKALYDGSIAYSDHCAKALYRELGRMGVMDNTIFTVTADHGDNLGEHGLLSHVHCLYDTLIRIPLIVEWPEGTGPQGAQDYIVQNTDLFPTMVELLGSKDGLNGELEGKSMISTRRQSQEDYAISELIKPFGPDAMPFREMLSKYDRRLTAVRSKAYKYIWSSRGDHEFYDIAGDPNEERNLYARWEEDRYSEALRQLVAYAKPWVERSHALYEKLKGAIEMLDAPEIDEDIKSRLSQLGYF